MFESVLYAAIITQILVGWSRLISEYGTYKFYWGHLFWSIVAFMFMTQRYYTFRQFPHYELITNTFTFILIVVMIPSSFFMANWLIFPDSYKDVDFKELIVRHRFPIFLPVILAVSFTAFINVYEGNTGYSYWLPHAVNNGVFLIFLFNKKLIFMEIGLFIGFIAMAYFMTIL